MGQEEVIEVLKKSKNPLSLKEISEILKISECLAGILIKKLLQHQEIQCIEIDRKIAMKFYSCKRKMRLYYI